MIVIVDEAVAECARTVASSTRRKNKMNFTDAGQLTNSTLTNSTTLTKSLIDDIARVCLLSIYPINFIFAAIGLTTLYRYIRKEKGPTTPFIQMVVRITLVGVFLGKQAH